MTQVNNNFAIKRGLARPTFSVGFGLGSSEKISLFLPVQLKFSIHIYFPECYSFH